MPNFEDVANEHARQAVREGRKWDCLCRDCRAQKAVDDVELAGKIWTMFQAGELPTWRLVEVAPGAYKLVRAVRTR